MTPGEEDIMRIYKDGIYHLPDMIEKPGGLHIKGSSIRDGGSCSLQSALHHPVVEAYSDLELEELLRDKPKPGTPPVSSPAARITTEAANESAEDVEAYVDQLQVIAKRLLPRIFKFQDFPSLPHRPTVTPFNPLSMIFVF